VAKKAKMPGPIERRHLIERELSADQALDYAEAYLEAGRDSDAIAFLVKADAQEQLTAIQKRAIESGDLFLFRAAAAARGVAPENYQWRELARAAAAAGKQRYAAEAERQAERKGG